MKFYKEKEDVLGFKSLNIPKQINTLTLYYAYEFDDKAREYLSERLRLSLIYEGSSLNSNEYFAGDYFIKKVNGNEYYVLNSKNVQGIFIAYQYGNLVELKSILYMKKEDKLVLKIGINTNDGSTHTPETFIYEKGEVTSKFLEHKLEDFENKFFQEASECDGLDQIINIGNLKDVVIDKTGKVLS